MATRTQYNQFQGINPHLHSYWQAYGGWSAFHTAHIGDLNKALKAQLLPMGYTTDIEPSVQIRRLDSTIGYPEADVGIFDLDTQRAQHPQLRTSPSPTDQIIPILELIAEAPLSEKPYYGIGVYEVISKSRQGGQLVAWLELLSPSNKRQSEDARLYREKRLNLLRGGIVFIELDYLHETPPTFVRLPHYRATNPDAHPYQIAVIDPRPDFEQGQGVIRAFDVDSPIPTASIPLSGDDALRFDFGQPYQKTYEEMLYGLEVVDYAELPVSFQRYSPTDQHRILRRMVTVLAAYQQGQNLSRQPLPLMDIPPSLEEAHTLLQAYR